MNTPTVILVFLIILSWNASANTVENGPFTVSKLRFGDTGLHIALSPAPTGCGGGNQFGMHLKLDPAMASYHSQMISGLLASYVSGSKLFRIWYESATTCDSNQLLHLQIFELEAKYP